MQRRAGRAQHLVKSLGVAQVNAGVGPPEPGDPGQRLARGGREAFLLARVASGDGPVGEMAVAGYGQAAAAADVPEQVRLMVGVGADQGHRPG